MEKKQIKLAYIFSLGLILNFSISNSQTKNDNAIYNWYDNVIGKNNLEIRNGKIHTNFDNTLESENRYFDADNTIKGSVIYNNQNYNDLLLRYDIQNDELIYKLYEENKIIQINLNKESILSFNIGKLKFVNLDNINLPLNIKKGYYEEKTNEGKFKLYIKHHKQQKKIIKNNIIFIKYLYYPSFILYYKNNYYEINNKKKIIKLLPNHKEKIKSFFSKNRDLQKKDEIKFLEELVQYMNTF